jgi:Fe(II)/alpha-ketoglutarate-dependent arginine beta-hydroxylase
VFSFSLVESDVEAVQRLVREIAATYGSAEAPALLREAALWSHALPRCLRRAFLDFKLTEHAPAIRVSGYPIDDARIGRTPAHWMTERPRTRALEEEILLVLCASLLGDVFGWSTQQDGRIVHDVLPIRGHEHEQVSSASEAAIWWHTEDAFHPYAGDYVGLFCLRNPTRTATTMAALDVTRLTDEDVDLLTRPEFVIKPDDSHQKKHQAVHWNGSHTSGESLHDGQAMAAYDAIAALNDAPPRVPVLYGARGDYYLKLDPYFMDRDALTPAADRALAHLIDAIDASLTDVVLDAGDILFVDNCKAVHGRRPFTAAHDGRDRWLKRINVTRDLRKSRDARSAPDARVIGEHARGPRPSPTQKESWT